MTQAALNLGGREKANRVELRSDDVADAIQSFLDTVRHWDEPVFQLADLIGYVQRRAKFVTPDLVKHTLRAATKAGHAVVKNDKDGWARCDRVAPISTWTLPMPTEMDLRVRRLNFARWSLERAERELAEAEAALE